MFVELEGGSALVEIALFDRMSREEAADAIRRCCASDRWITELVAGRPYGSLRELSAASDAALGELDWADVAQALGAHPRIGERLTGGGQESVWSRQEQSGATDPALADELVAGNLAYEQRFGHVFLICATGRTAPEILAALRARLDNPTEVEHLVVRAELRQIVRLRLIKTFR